MLNATLAGNIGGDPEMRYSSGNNTAQPTAILRLNVASNYRERNQQGEYEDRVEWVRVTVMGPRAEKLSEMLHKGMKILAIGQLKARPWTDQQGNLRSGLEILANEIEFLSPRGENGGQDRQSGQPARPRQQAQQPAANGAGADQLPF